MPKASAKQQWGNFNYGLQGVILETLRNEYEKICGNLTQETRDVMEAIGRNGLEPDRRLDKEQRRLIEQVVWLSATIDSLSNQQEVQGGGTLCILEDRADKLFFMLASEIMYAELTKVYNKYNRTPHMRILENGKYRPKQIYRRWLIRWTTAEGFCTPDEQKDLNKKFKILQDAMKLTEQDFKNIYMLEGNSVKFGIFKRFLIKIGLLSVGPSDEDKQFAQQVLQYKKEIRQLGITRLVQKIRGNSASVERPLEQIIPEVQQPEVTPAIAEREQVVMEEGKKEEQVPAALQQETVQEAGQQENKIPQPLAPTVPQPKDGRVIGIDPAELKRKVDELHSDSPIEERIPRRHEQLQMTVSNGLSDSGFEGMGAFKGKLQNAFLSSEEQMAQLKREAELERTQQEEVNKKIEAVKTILSSEDDKPRKIEQLKALGIDLDFLTKTDPATTLQRQKLVKGLAEAYDVLRQVFDLNVDAEPERAPVDDPLMREIQQAATVRKPSLPTISEEGESTSRVSQELPVSPISRAPQPASDMSASFIAWENGTDDPDRKNDPVSPGEKSSVAVGREKIGQWLAEVRPNLQPAASEGPVLDRTTVRGRAESKRKKKEESMTQTDREQAAVEPEEVTSSVSARGGIAVTKPEKETTPSAPIRTNVAGLAAIFENRTTSVQEKKAVATKQEPKPQRQKIDSAQLAATSNQPGNEQRKLPGRLSPELIAVAERTAQAAKQQKRKSEKVHSPATSTQLPATATPETPPAAVPVPTADSETISQSLPPIGNTDGAPPPPPPLPPPPPNPHERKRGPGVPGSRKHWTLEQQPQAASAPQTQEKGPRKPVNKQTQQSETLVAELRERLGNRSLKAHKALNVTLQCQEQGQKQNSADDKSHNPDPSSTPPPSDEGNPA